MRKNGILFILKGYLSSRIQIKRKGITHIFTSHQPISNHWIAFFLKKEFPKLFWIADFRDAYPDWAKTEIYFQSFHIFLLKILLKKCDLITTVSKGLTTHLEIAKKPILIIKNSPLKIQAIPKLKIIKFVYTGSIYPKKYRLDLLFKTLNQFDSSYKFGFLYCGKDRKTWDKEINNFPQFINLSSEIVSHENALAIQSLGDILLVFTWNTEKIKGVLTSKLGEYLAFKKPILILVNGNYEEEFEMLKKIHFNCYVFYTLDHPLNRLFDIINLCIQNIDNQLNFKRKIFFENEFNQIKHFL